MVNHNYIMVEESEVMWFAKYGGPNYWQDVGERFYRKVLAHKVLRQYFATVRRERVKEIVTDMWQMSLGFYGPMSIAAIGNAHKGLRIPTGHFDAYLALFRDTLREEDVDNEDIEEIVGNVKWMRQFVCIEE